MAETGINFRATAGYVTDPATDTYSLGEAYPTTRGGITFGWATNKTAQTRDRSAGLVRLGGIVFHTNGAATTTFRVDLPSAGTYRIRLAAGDTAAAQAQRILIKDGTTTLATLAASTAANQWMDATGVVRTSYSDWTNNNASVDLAFSGTQLILECGDAGGSGSLATSLSHLNWDLLSVPDTTPPTLTSPTGTGGTVTCSGTVSTDEANGNLYAVFTASATAPTAAQVKLGQDHTGAAALRAVGPQSVTATGTQAIASGSITAGTRFAHYMHEDAAANQSAVVSSSSFTVSAGGSSFVSRAYFDLSQPRS